jgi:hypothetical protein
VQALLTAAGMVEETAEMARRCRGQTKAEGLPFIEADRFGADARKLHKDLSGSALRRLFALAGLAGGDSAARQMRSRQVLGRLSAVLGELFHVLGEYCKSSRAVEQWEQIYTLFLRELEPIVDALVP